MPPTPPQDGAAIPGDPLSPTTLIHDFLRSKGLQPTSENVSRALQANAMSPGFIPSTIPPQQMPIPMINDMPVGPSGGGGQPKRSAAPSGVVDSGNFDEGGPAKSGATAGNSFMDIARGILRGLPIPDLSGLRLNPQPPETRLLTGPQEQLRLPPPGGAAVAPETVPRLPPPTPGATAAPEVPPVRGGVPAVPEVPAVPQAPAPAEIPNVPSVRGPTTLAETILGQPSGRAPFEPNAGRIIDVPPEALPAPPTRPQIAAPPEVPAVGGPPPQRQLTGPSGKPNVSLPGDNTRTQALPPQAQAPRGGMLNTAGRLIPALMSRNPAAIAIALGMSIPEVLEMLKGTNAPVSPQQ